MIVVATQRHLLRWWCQDIIPSTYVVPCLRGNSAYVLFKQCHDGWVYCLLLVHFCYFLSNGLKSLKIATYSAADSATDSDFLQTTYQVQVQDAEHENDLHFNFQGDFQGLIRGQRTGYRISSQNYASTCTKMVSDDSWPA